MTNGANELLIDPPVKMKADRDSSNGPEWTPQWTAGAPTDLDNPPARDGSIDAQPPASQPATETANASDEQLKARLEELKSQVEAMKVNNQKIKQELSQAIDLLDDRLVKGNFVKDSSAHKTTNLNAYAMTYIALSGLRNLITEDMTGVIESFNRAKSLMQAAEPHVPEMGNSYKADNLTLTAHPSTTSIAERILQDDKKPLNEKIADVNLLIKSDEQARNNTLIHLLDQLEPTFTSETGSTKIDTETEHRIAIIIRDIIGKLMELKGPDDKGNPELTQKYQALSKEIPQQEPRTGTFS